ncbi:dihydropteroate synthase [Cognatiyoonia koreensis]|uniref:Dihydropteroate synthase n=1 Tax=Cognatiyoonia koreensis TaxID=364200 RepID=A0A1I0NET9_9RHOB|nr:dihydropteroate synthase [Cognatiyoonia koreensis]SEV99937.1 dihydropteroate synthase [Cognatiyoonia koreensis]
MTYFRPLVQTDGAFVLAGGWARFDRVEVLTRGAAPRIVAAADIPDEIRTRLTAPRPAIMSVSLDQPRVMGILNVTPDSFSDGGDFVTTADAVCRAKEMLTDGAQFIDIGGESTRPGAREVPVAEELQRVAPVVERVAALEHAVVSVDTRKAAVVAGITADVLVNDVSAMRFDSDMARTVAGKGAPVCLMHSIATPETMQANAAYDDVLLDVYDHLEERIAFAEKNGIARAKIIVDPGIGFGKTLEHNLILIRGLSLFHGLGCPILLGASRKRFIGTIGNAPEAKDRLGGSLSVALEGVRQGVQILRVHDTFATKQALDLQMAMIGTAGNDT